MALDRPPPRLSESLGGAELRRRFRQNLSDDGGSVALRRLEVVTCQLDEFAGGLLPSSGKTVTLSSRLSNSTRSAIDCGRCR